MAREKHTFWVPSAGQTFSAVGLFQDIVKALGEAHPGQDWQYLRLERATRAEALKAARYEAAGAPGFFLCSLAAASAVASLQAVSP